GSLDLRPDPFRMKIALRTGIAVVAALLTPVILGWGLVTLVAPMAFMAAVLTRGAAVQTVLAMSTVVALGWVIADLALVYVTPHWGRMPGVLVVPFALAVAFALVSAGRPALALLPSIGGLIAFIGIFGGTGAALGVEGPYDTVCYIATGFGIGAVFGRAMWPATAAGLFRQRVAAQLTLCLEAARHAREPGLDRRAWGRTLVEGFAQHTAALGPLHQQALHEPIEDGLGPERRAQALTLTNDLADAILEHRPDALVDVEPGETELAPLRQALDEAHEALIESLEHTVEAWRGGEDERVAGRLAATHEAVEAELRARGASLAADSERSEESWRPLLVVVDTYRRVVFRQLAIERWLDEWRAREASPR
ncbi:MAG: hypothetical protein JRH10_17250, partial [Deltaproteobacteria bacterium]|nr:hypothetical protein [Deltaproteobacteria bacterium]